LIFAGVPGKYRGNRAKYDEKRFVGRRRGGYRTGLLKEQALQGIGARLKIKIYTKSHKTVK